MSVLSSPSPTLSPRPSFSSHDRSLASLRRSSSKSYRPSPSGSHVFSSHVSSPNLSLPTSTPISAPKKRPIDDDPKRSTTDTGTQYTPPEYPPTASRSMSSTNIFGGPIPRNTSRIEEGIKDVEIKDTHDAPVAESPEPPEPVLRQDPEPHTPPGTAASVSTPASGHASDQSALESPLKRTKGESAVKIMPLDYMKCDVRDLGIVIADMLMELVRINDPLPFKNEQLTRYHSRAPPGISVHDYLSRLIVHATLSPPILLSLVYYIDKLSALYPVFNISSLTVHRYLITTACVAAKGLSDSFWTNNTYSRVGGISVRELALLELDFLERMDWRIVPPADVLVDYYKNLVERNDNYKLEEQPTTEG